MNETTQPAVAGPVEPTVMPHAWWRLSTLPECRPCVTTDRDEARDWLKQGHDVRVLTERHDGPCDHDAPRWVTWQGTYAMHWVCLRCGEGGESSWD